MRRLLAGTVTALALALAGCGGSGGEDFAVESAVPVGKLAAGFGEIDMSEAEILFPGLAISRSKPSENEILYTIPGSNGSSSTVRLTFASGANGGSTISAAVDVPPTQATIDGMIKQLSEPRIEAELERIVGRAAAGGDSGSVMNDMSSLLLGIAVATDSNRMLKVLALGPDAMLLESMMGAFDAGGGSDTYVEDPRLDGSKQVDVAFDAADEAALERRAEAREVADSLRPEE